MISILKTILFFLFFLSSLGLHAEHHDEKYDQFCLSTLQNDLFLGSDIGYTHGLLFSCEVFKKKDYTISATYDSKLFTESVNPLSEEEVELYRELNIILPQRFQNNATFFATIDNKAQSIQSNNVYLSLKLGITDINNQSNRDILSPSVQQEKYHSSLLSFNFDNKIQVHEFEYQKEDRPFFLNLHGKYLNINFAVGKIFSLGERSSNSNFSEFENQVTLQFGVQSYSLDSLDSHIPLEAHLKLKLDKNIKNFPNGSRLSFIYEPTYFETIKNKKKHVSRRVFNQHLGVSYTNSKKTQYQFGLIRIYRIDNDSIPSLVTKNEYVWNVSLKFKINK